MCPACGSGTPGAPVPCLECRNDLCRAPERLIAPGIVVRSGFVHRGAARRMIHRLKYEAAVEIAEVFAVAMEGLVPSTATAMVPVPRARLRAWRYGVDPAVSLAEALGRRTGVPVVRALRGALWWPRHAGRRAGARAVPSFAMAAPPAAGMVLIDDVLTTGATMAAAAHALGGGVIFGLTATGAGTLWKEDTDPRRRPGEAGWR